MPLRLLLAFLLWMSASEAVAVSKLELKIDPPAGQLRPNRDEARLTLRSEGEEAAGKMLHWSLSMELPPRGRFFSTDFPWIEGKRLFQVDFFTAGREVEWSMVFPIRGRYELRVAAWADRESRTEARFPLVIHEDPARLFYLALFLIGLFLFGGFIGWVTPRPRAILGLPLLILMAGAAPGGRLDVGPARVGDLTPIRFMAADGAEVGFSIVRAEDQKKLFHIEGITVRGSAAWGYHFFDGSPHRLQATIRFPNATEPHHTEKEIPVEAREPPWSTVLAACTFFALPLAAGWPAGMWLRSRRKL